MYLQLATGADKSPGTESLDISLVKTFGRVTRTIVSGSDDLDSEQKKRTRKHNSRNYQMSTDHGLSGNKDTAKYSQPISE